MTSAENDQDFTLYLVIFVFTYLELKKPIGVSGCGGL